MADGFKDPVQVARTALAMKRVCDLDRWKDSTGKYHQAVHDHLTALTAERDALRAEVERLREALTEIGSQKKTTELETEYYVEVADFEDGYDMCIDRARAVLGDTDT